MSGYAYEPLFKQPTYGSMHKTSAFAPATPTFSSLLHSRSRELGHKFAVQVDLGRERVGERTINPLMLTPLRPSTRGLGLGAPFTLGGRGTPRRPQPAFTPNLEKPVNLGRLVQPVTPARLEKPVGRTAPVASTGAGTPPGPWDTRSLGGPRQFAGAPSADPAPFPRGVRWQLRASEGVTAQLRSSEVVR